MVANEARRSFPRSVESPAAARRFIAATLRDWGYEQLVIDASAVVSELATNSVVHARSPFSVTLSRHDDRLRLTVGDASETLPVLRVADRPLASGHGLVLVRALSTRWGTEPTGEGKIVWAEFDTAGARVSY
jgi:anti-sigma regulatory factor (Ser/Thr protein kinase)